MLCVCCIFMLYVGCGKVNKDVGILYCGGVKVGWYGLFGWEKN